MASSSLPDRERPMLCELLSVPPSTASGSRGGCSSDEYVRCSNEIAGRYRLCPDAGDPVEVWLCSDHASEYEDHIVEVLDER